MQIGKLDQTSVQNPTAQYLDRAGSMHHAPPELIDYRALDVPLGATLDLPTRC